MQCLPWAQSSKTVAALAVLTLTRMAMAREKSDANIIVASWSCW